MRLVCLPLVNSSPLTLVSRARGSALSTHSRGLVPVNYQEHILELPIFITNVVAGTNFTGLSSQMKRSRIQSKTKSDCLHDQPLYNLMEGTSPCD